MNGFIIFSNIKKGMISRKNTFTFSFSIMAANRVTRIGAININVSESAKGKIVIAKKNKTVDKNKKILRTN